MAVTLKASTHTPLTDKLRSVKWIHCHGNNSFIEGEHANLGPSVSIPYTEVGRGNEGS